MRFRDLQRLINCNDNRAVYRSRFLLDDDAGRAGGASGPDLSRPGV